MRNWIFLLFILIDQLERCMFGAVTTPGTQFISLNSTLTNVTFSSPGFDEGQYPANSHALWEIRTTPHKTIKVTFEVFMLEYHWSCVWDYVKISEKACDDYSDVTRIKYCGTKTEFTYNSSSHVLCVEFISDIVQNRRGFRAIAISFLGDNQTSTAKPTISTTETITDVSHTPGTPKTQSSPQTQSNHISTTSTLGMTTTQTLPFSTSSLKSNTSSANGKTTASSTDELMDTTMNPTTDTSESPIGSTTILPVAHITLSQGLMNEVNVEEFSEVFIHTPKDSTGKYPTNFQSILNIINSKERELHLIFEYFQVEYNTYCSWDYLIIQHTQSTGPLCGNSLPQPITSTVPKVTIQFYSDSVIPDGGFELRVYVNRPTSEPGSTDSPISSSKQPITTNFSLPKLSTTQTSSSHSSTKATGSSSTKSITISSSTKPLSTVLSSTTNSNLKTTSHKSSSISSKPPTTSTTTKPISDSAYPGPEHPFVTPSYYQELSVCGNSEMSIDGMGPTVIKSPTDENGNYPLNLFCILRIRNLSQKTIKIEFSQFHVEQNTYCSWDYVTVHAHVKYGPYCGSSLPSDIITNGGEITVEFRSDSIIPDKGFAMILVKLEEYIPTATTQKQSSSIQSSPTTSHTSSSTFIKSSTSPMIGPTSVSGTFPLSPPSSETSPPAFTSLISTLLSSTSTSSQKTTSTSLSNSLTNTIPTSSQYPSNMETTVTSTLSNEDIQKTSNTHFLTSTSQPHIIKPTSLTTPESSSHETPGNTKIEMCSQSVLDNFNEITIFTQGYTDGLKYPLNQNCEMAVPGDKDDIIIMTIEDFNVEQNSYCSWDALYIHFEDTIYKLCGYISNTDIIDFTDECKYGNFVQYNDKLGERSCFIDTDFSRLFNFTSEGKLLLRFVSDSVINQKGFKIKIQRNKGFWSTSKKSVEITTATAVPRTTTEPPTALITKTPSRPSSLSTSYPSSITSSSRQSTASTNPDDVESVTPTGQVKSTTQPPSNQATYVGVSDSNNVLTVTMSRLSSVIKTGSVNTQSQPKTTSSQKETSVLYTSNNTLKPTTSVGNSLPLSESQTPTKTSSASTKVTTKSLPPIVTSSFSNKPVTTSTPKTSTSSTEGVLPSACSANGTPFQLKDDVGYIESPKMFNQSTYPPNTVCRWKIEDVNGELISLIFEWFDLEQSEGCMWDKLGIFEVVTDGAMKTKAVLCGDKLPETITASSDVLIEFSSDTHEEKTGFRLKFLKTDKSNQDSRFTCLPAMTPCWSSVPQSCMPVEWICDGEMDCPDMSDEAKCPTCGVNEFSCGGSKCINMQSRCDGKPDCPHGVDEQDCGNYKSNIFTSENIDCPVGSVLHENQRLLYLCNAKRYKLVAISEEGRVEVLVKGNSMPLCYSQTVDSHKNMVCIASLFRAATEGRSKSFADTESPDFAIMSIDENLNAIYFKSSTCALSETTSINCLGQGCGQKSAHARRKRIIGGTTSDDGEWPWTVALRAGNKMICGGTIVDKEWVVTAGHCVKDLRKNPQIASIMAGVRDIHDVNAQIRYVTEVALHPEYFYIFNADIALLKLESPLIFNEFVQQICLPWDKREFSLASRCFIAGWGVSNMTEYYTTVAPQYLRHAKTKLVSRESCISSYSTFSEISTTINEGMICAGYTGGGIDACKGDSGSGLMCQVADSRWVLAGIISWGDMCGSTHKPGVYTKVTSYVSWLNDTLGFKGPGSVNCSFESSDWCGYEAISESKYIWTRKPGDKWISGNILYAVRADYDLSLPANASLFTPSFSAGIPRCLGFQFLFSGNSNITLSIYGITEESGTTGVTTTEKLLWRITSHYPAMESWQTSETNVPDDVTRLKFVSLHEHGGISGIGLDNVTLQSTPCSNLNFMKCNFNDENFCQYSSHTYTMFNKEWKIKHRGKSKEDYAVWTGGDDSTFGQMALSQLVSPALTPSFTSLPHCLAFSFYKENNTTNELNVLTYSEIFQQLTNQRLFWSSGGFMVGQWHEVKVTIIRTVDYFDHIVLEVRRDGTGNVGIMVDDLGMYDGTCL